MTKKALLWISLVILGLFALFGLTYAKGGGGGGGGGGSNLSCTADRFDCTQWTDCSPFGEQTRMCQLIADCASVDDPLPVMKRSCTPPTPVKKTAPAAPVSCKKDEYQCSSWGVCEEDGKNRRSCTLVKDCPGVKTPAPAQEQVCGGLKCGQLSNLQKRVECRLKLTPQQARREQQILYAPEYCRLEEGPQEKAECINLYWALERCWAMPASPERQTCGKEVTGFGEIEKKKTVCTDPSCDPEVKETVEKWRLFQIYEFEFLAESLMKAGKASLKDVTAFDVWIERQKAKMEKTESVKAWEKLFNESKARWEKFAKAHAR